MLEIYKEDEIDPERLTIVQKASLGSASLADMDGVGFLVGFG